MNLTPDQLIAEARIWRGVHTGATMTVENGAPLAELLEQAADALASAQQQLAQPARTGCDDCLDARRALEAELASAQQRIQELEQERDRAKLEMLDEVEAEAKRYANEHDFFTLKELVLDALRASLTRGQEPTP